MADRRQGYDADWFREALKDKGIHPCIPGRKSRGKTVRYDKRRHKRSNRIEIMFGRLKDWRRIATRYDRCATTFGEVIELLGPHRSRYTGAPAGTTFRSSSSRFGMGG